jgi:ATP phosphoribosyltransferase
MRPLRFALTKGRLEEKTIDLLEKIGCDCSAVRNKGRKLILPVDNGKYEVVLAKAADVITYVEHGVCDLGVVGKDTIMEHGGSFYEVLDLGFGKCRFALAGPKGCDFFTGYSSRTVASKYPNVTAKYFSGKAMDVRIIKIEGSVELAPLLGLSDAIVDIVETGSTLKENGLEVIDTVCDISARLIVNAASMKLRKDEIEELVNRMEKVIRKEA